MGLRQISEEGFGSRSLWRGPEPARAAVSGRPAVMAKRRKPRTPTPRCANLTQQSLAKVLDTGEHPGELDLEILLVALGIGALDDHLEEIGTIVNNRTRALNAIDELRTTSRLHVGDRMHLGHNLRPQYLAGRGATIIARAVTNGSSGSTSRSGASSTPTFGYARSNSTGRGRRNKYLVACVVVLPTGAR